MHPQTALTWSYLNVLTKKRVDLLKEVFGDLDAALKRVGEEMLRGFGCREDTVLKALNRLEEFDPDTYAKELQRRGLTLITIEDDAYPSLLKEIGDPPVFLYYKGSLPILDQICIALVGTREMSSYGKRVVEHFVPTLVRAGVTIVSGLALGIDAEVAKETLRASGKTVAVLGHGLGAIYPKANESIAKEIIAQGGLILSEYPLDIPPDKFTFPGRNRIIAGLCQGTVVLEAGDGSGALITADLALDYGRDAFAVPGEIFSPTYAGCHEILSRGQAKLVTKPEDILTEIGMIAPSAEPHSIYQPQDAAEEALFKALSSMPQNVDELTEKSALPAGSIAAALTMMELAGAAKNVGEGKWVRT